MNQEKLKNTLEIVSCVLLIIQIALCVTARQQGLDKMFAMALGIVLFCLMTYMTYRFETHATGISVVKCEVMFLCVLYAMSLLTQQHQHLIVGGVFLVIGAGLIKEGSS